MKGATGMNSTNGVENIDFPLYHGTSTLFLESIVKHGLGGCNPIEEWKVLECAREIYPLVQEHLASDQNYESKMFSFELMTQQSQNAMNFQHGDTYLSPAKGTAIRYAIDKKYGSELLSYTLDFLDGLVTRRVAGVCDKLYRKYPQIFTTLQISAAPMLFVIDGVKISDLLTEKGFDPLDSVASILDARRDYPNDSEVFIQQTNFRLKKPVAINNVSAWLINVSKWHIGSPEYSLRQVVLE